MAQNAHMSDLCRDAQNFFFKSSMLNWRNLLCDLKFYYSLQQRIQFPPEMTIRNYHENNQYGTRPYNRYYEIHSEHSLILMQLQAIFN